MSHLHSITGQLDSADRYQAFLDRTNAARLAREKEEVRKRSGVPFESIVDPDRDPRENPDGEPRQEEEREGEPEGQSEPVDGFGKHYA
jgi:hypothetical protein